MSKAASPPPEDRDTMRAEYDFSRAVRGVTARRYAQGTNVVVVAPDLLDVFPDAKAVDDALRALAPILRRTASSLQPPCWRRLPPDFFSITPSTHATQVRAELI